MGNFIWPEWMPQPQATPPPSAPPPDPMVAREEKIANDTRVEQALNQFLIAKQGALFDAPDAFYRTQGEDAIHAAPVATKNLQQLRNTLLDGLANDYQRQRLGNALDAQMQVTRDGMARHVAEQSLAWQRGVAQDRIALLAKEAALHHNDTDLVDALGHAAATAARAHSRVGDGPPGGEAEDAAAATARSGVLSAAIQARLDRGDTTGANALLAQVQDQLDPAHAAPLQGQIDTLQRLGAAKDYADGIASAAPAASLEEIDAQHQAALQQAEADHADDPRRQAFARHFLKQAFDIRRQELQQGDRNSAVDQWLNTPRADGGSQRDLPSPAILSSLDDDALEHLVFRLGRDDRGANVVPLLNKPSLDEAPVPEKNDDATPIVPIRHDVGEDSDSAPQQDRRPFIPSAQWRLPEDGNSEGAQGRGIAPVIEPLPGSPEYETAMNIAVGRPVTLPDGSPIPDDTSPTGKLMSSTSNLGEVADAGRKAGARYRALLENPHTAQSALASLTIDLGLALGHGGRFDYQRGPGNSITGFEQRPWFRNISNVNVGLFGQQAGLSLDELLYVAGQFAKWMSKNSDPNDAYNLDAQTRRFIELGYQLGASGKFDKPSP